MTRMNLLLTLAILGTALYLINVQYESRRLFAALDMANAEARKIAIERERLVLEKGAQATPGRVDKIAREQLQMRAATPATTQYLGLPASWYAQGALPAAAQREASLSAGNTDALAKPTVQPRETQP